jgi:hypothetical protein
MTKALKYAANYTEQGGDEQGMLVGEFSPSHVRIEYSGIRRFAQITKRLVELLEQTSKLIISES